MEVIAKYTKNLMNVWYGSRQNKLSSFHVGTTFNFNFNFSIIIISSPTFVRLGSIFFINPLKFHLQTCVHILQPSSINLLTNISFSQINKISSLNQTLYSILVFFHSEATAKQPVDRVVVNVYKVIDTYDEQVNDAHSIFGTNYICKLAPLPGTA